MLRQGELVASKGSRLRSYYRFVILSLCLVFLPSLHTNAAEVPFNEFSLNGKTFVQIGTVVENNNDDDELRCSTEIEAPHTIFDFLLKDGDSDTSPTRLRNTYIRDICVARYFPLGGDKFLVLYRGLGIVDLKNKTYARIIAHWVDEDWLSKRFLINARTSFAIYEAKFTQHGEDIDAYFALTFESEDNDQITVKYANLSDAQIGDDTNRPLCKSAEEDGKGNQTATSILRPKIGKISATERVAFTFTKMHKNCVSGKVRKEKEVYEYENGKVFNKLKGSVPLRAMGN